MSKKAVMFLVLFFAPGISYLYAQRGELLQYHNIQADKNGNIIPWYSADVAKAYDHNIRLVWNFWINMRRDPNGLPYYMDHQVWNKNIDDPRGIAPAIFPQLENAIQKYYWLGSFQLQ